MSFDFNDRNYDQYCSTEKQKEALKACRECGSKRGAARKLGIDDKSLRTRLQGVERQAKNSGYIPQNGMTEPFDPLLAHQKSTVHVKDGQVVEYWARMSPDEEKWQKIREKAIEAFCEPLPKIKVRPFSKKNLDKDVIPWLQIGDGHIGMLSHKNETGHNFDLKIAERELCKATATLISRAPDAERCVINDLGDLTHFTNNTATTEASGNLLDYDTRFWKMIEVYARTLRFIIDTASQKFKYVDVILNQGNHSSTNDVAARVWATMLYEGAGRVNFLDNTPALIPYRMGNTFVVTTHTDKMKPEKAASAMAVDYRQDFGECKYKYIDGGHLHNDHARLTYGETLFQCWNNLAPNDKWHSDKGYRNSSYLTMVQRSRTYGEIGTQRVTREQVRDILDKVPAGTSAQERRKVYTV